MPLYDLRCPNGCGVWEDWVCSIEERLTQSCPDCGEHMRTVPPVVQTVGPMPSKPLVIKQIGKRFESTAELRQYERENPGVVFQSQTSTEWRRHKDEVRERCEKTARKQGFRDLDHKREVTRKESPAV